MGDPRNGWVERVLVCPQQVVESVRQVVGREYRVVRRENPLRFMAIDHVQVRPELGCQRVDHVVVLPVCYRMQGKQLPGQLLDLAVHTVDVAEREGVNVADKLAQKLRQDRADSFSGATKEQGTRHRASLAMRRRRAAPLASAASASLPAPGYSLRSSAMTLMF
jgi:hypothetical protein